MITDDQLEDRVRRTLRAVADATPVDADACAEPAYATGARRQRPGWLPLLTAAAAVLVVVLGGVLVLRAGDDDVTVASPSSTSPPTPVPPTPSDRPGLSDGPIFSGPGDASEVFHAYRQTRLPDVSTNVVSGDGVATATWSFDDDSGRVASGTVHLAYLAEQWAVVEAETDDVAIEDLRLENGTLEATISTTNVNSFVVEVLDLDGNRLRGSERIGPMTEPLDLDVTIGEQPVVVRVQLIGGTMLSITEVRVDPLSPDGGDVAGEGSWAGGGWRLLRDADCAWIELNGVAHRPVCEIGGDAVFHQFGPVSRFGEETLYFGIVGSEVMLVRFDLGGGESVDAAPTGGMVAVAVPAVGPVDVTFSDAGGNTLDELTVDPSGPLGG